MPKKIELQKHTLNLRKGDYDAIAEAVVDKDITAGEVIRSIVSRFVDKSLNASAQAPQLDAEVKL